MATHQAIGAVAQAVARLLEDTRLPAPLRSLAPEFVVYQAKDFAAPMECGVSVFVHRVSIDPVQRTQTPTARSHGNPLLLTVSLMLTAWGTPASVAHDLLGWAMRVIADNPTLASTVLDAAGSGAFSHHETVTLTPLDLTHDEMVGLWQVLPNDLQLSVSYLARTVHVEPEPPDRIGPTP